MRMIDEQYLRTPFFGSRRMTAWLAHQGEHVNRKRVGRLMARMGLEAIFPGPRTSTRNPDHAVYPYLLRGLTIDRRDQVRSTDITYIPLEQGFMYLLDLKKDMIITGGENVYTVEVEQTLYQHPAVAECAVVGVPDEKYGESLFAAIVMQPGKTLTKEQVIEHCRQRIGGYKVPRQMVFLPALP